MDQRDSTSLSSPSGLFGHLSDARDSIGAGCNRLGSFDRYIVVEPNAGNREEQCILRPRDQSKAARDPGGYKPFRCICGSILARLVSEGVELKCRRCKRQIIVPLETTDRARRERQT